MGLGALVEQALGGGRPARGSAPPGMLSAALTADEQTGEDDYERSAGNVSDLQGALAKETRPAARQALEGELKRIQGSQATTPGGLADTVATALGTDVPHETLHLPAKNAVSQDAQPSAPATGRNPLSAPPADAAAAIATGIGGTILGGLHGMYKLATTGDPNQAADTVRSTQEALTYAPRTEGGKKAVELVGSGWNPLNWPGMAGKALAERGVDSSQMRPDEAAGLEALSTIVSPGALIKGAGLALKGGSTAARVASEAAAARAPAGPAGAAVADMPFGSVGASAVSRTASLKADLQAATPEMRKALSSVKDVNPEALARQLEGDSLPVPVRLTKGQATQNIETLSLEQNTRGKNPELAHRFNEQNGQLIENINEIRERAAPDVYGTNHVENGQSLIDAYKTTDSALRSDISAKYKALEDANGGKFPVDGILFVDTAEAALKKKLKSEFVPAPIARQMEKFKNGEPMDLEQFEALRTNLAAEMRKAERSGDGNAAYAAGIVRDALESLPMSGGAEALKPVADAARAAAKARFDLLKKDPAYKAAINDTVAADDFINKFVVKGKADKVQTMVDHLGKDSTAHQTMAAGVINYLKSRAGIVNEAGNFSQAGYNKALQELKPKLLAIVGPQAAKQIETLGNVARYTQAQPRGSFVNNSNTLVGALGEHAKSLLEGTANKVLGLGVVPIGSMVRDASAKRATAKEVMNSLQTGAGVSLKDIGK